MQRASANRQSAPATPPNPAPHTTFAASHSRSIGPNSDPTMPSSPVTPGAGSATPSFPAASAPPAVQRAASAPPGVQPAPYSSTLPLPHVQRTPRRFPLGAPMPSPAPDTAPLKGSPAPAAPPLPTVPLTPVPHHPSAQHPTAPATTTATTPAALSVQRKTTPVTEPAPGTTHTPLPVAPLTPPPAPATADSPASPPVVQRFWKSSKSKSQHTPPGHSATGALAAAAAVTVGETLSNRISPAARPHHADTPPPYEPPTGPSADASPPEYTAVPAGTFDPRDLTDFQLDELVHRIIGRVTRLVRTELRMDRERIGKLRDPRR